MGTVLLKAYHRMPPFVRQIVASARGYQLHRWRYGAETDGMVREARARESWDASHWQDWLEPRLQNLLKRASEAVPYYRQEWQRQRDNGEFRSPQTLGDWPVLSKATVRRNPKDFLAVDAPVHSMQAEHTSGTTGTPLQLWHSREAVRLWFALMEARWRGWYGVSRRDHWAILGGQLVTPSHQKSPPFWVWNAGLKQLYLSSYHLSAQTCGAYLEAIKEHRVIYLWGYASSLYSLARFASEQPAASLGLKVIISNAEPLYEHQREVIQRVFACPVRDSYGMSEMACAASECEAGKMHLWPEVGMWEVLREDADEPVKPGELGRLVCTGLLNTEMPLIRYEVGDRVAVASPGQKCLCGRTMPILLTVDGRNDDVILTRDGRRIGRLDPVFKSDTPICEGQIIQESLDLVRMLVVPGPGFAPKHEAALISSLHERVGDIRIQLEKVVDIPRSANGKFRAVISKVKSTQPV